MYKFIYIIGFINSYDIQERFKQTPINLQVIHSLKNCLVSINHVDNLLQYNNDLRFNSTNFDGFFKNTSLKNSRNYTYIEGGHSILEENPEELSEIFENFINEE